MEPTDLSTVRAVLIRVVKTECRIKARMITPLEITKIDSEVVNSFMKSDYLQMIDAFHKFLKESYDPTQAK